MKKILQYWFTGKKSDINKEVTLLYELYKQPFISFALKNYPIDHEIAADIYQDSFTCVCENIKNKKYKESNTSLKTYLFEIGKHQICKYLNKNRIEFVSMPNLSSEWFEQNTEREEWIEAQDIVNRLIGESDADCNRILQMYYWEHLKMEEIAQRMDYKTNQVAKNKKSSCLRRFTFELKKRLLAAGIDWKHKKENHG